jgi:hypothetical protein
LGERLPFRSDESTTSGVASRRLVLETAAGSVVLIAFESVTTGSLLGCSLVRFGLVSREIDSLLVLRGAL